MSILLLHFPNVKSLLCIIQIKYLYSNYWTISKYLGSMKHQMVLFFVLQVYEIHLKRSNYIEWRITSLRRIKDRMLFDLEILSHPPNYEVAKDVQLLSLKVWHKSVNMNFDPLYRSRRRSEWRDTLTTYFSFFFFFTNGLLSELLIRMGGSWQNKNKLYTFGLMLNWVTILFTFFCIRMCVK